ncbi:MAG: DUF5916 domain-containing protein, partial [Pseudomonadales bacterium]
QKGIYVGIWNEQPRESLISRLSSRDLFINRDDVAITIDPSGQGLYAYWFAVTLGGTLQDGTVLPERQYSNQWDGPWHGASAEHESGWSAEFFLPWAMMTMPEVHGEDRKMGYYVSRYVAHRSERWSYPAYPRTRPVFLSQLPTLDIVGVEPKQQFTFYPYTSGTYDNMKAGHKDTYNAGFDIFWRPSTNLQLTATVSPDFGNVESDNVVVNLSSFETFFPEKRAFFLEGNEIFIATPRARHGTPTTLINTRRVGGSPRDPEIAGFVFSDLQANQPTELLGAAKVTGQWGRVRYGVLGASEDDTVIHGELAGAPSSYLQQGRDFGVARFLYEDTSQGGRRALGLLSAATYHPQGDALTTGVDVHFLTADGGINVDGQLMYSDVDGVTGGGGFADIVYTPESGYQHEVAFEYYDEKLDINDLGFLQRNDIYGLKYAFERNDSSHSRYKYVKTRVQGLLSYNAAGQVVKSGFFSLRDRQFANNNWLFTEFNYYPGRWDDINSNGNGVYRIKDRFTTGVFIATDEAKSLQFGLGTFVFTEHLGDISKKYNVELTWRPTDRFSAKLDLAYEDKDGWLIHSGARNFTTYSAEFWRPRIETDFFISARQQFRITAQWAGIKAFEQNRWQVPIEDGSLEQDTTPATGPRDFSISRLTFQARYRWEIAPLSDLFVVYTRGSNVNSRPHEDFGDLIRDSWTEPLVNTFVVKLRYRLGS